jgi:hypothetical protein
MLKHVCCVKRKNKEAVAPLTYGRVRVIFRGRALSYTEGVKDSYRS